MMQVIEGSFVPLPEAAGEIVADHLVHGWHFHPYIHWDKIGAGTKLYATQQLTAYAKACFETWSTPSTAQLEDSRHQGYVEGLRDANASIAAERAANQCDGCGVNAPLTAMGHHAMPDGGFMGCTKDRYQVGPALSADFFASRSAAPAFDRDTAEAWMLRAQVSLEKGEPGAARIEIEKALQFLNVGPAKEPL